MGSITPPDYPTLFFFEAGEWWDYAMLLVVIAALAFTAWLAQRNMWVVLAVFVVIPVALTIFWWPHSTLGTASAGWFPVLGRASSIPEAATQPLVPADSAGDPFRQHCRGRGEGFPVLRHSRGGSFPGHGDLGRSVEHHERDRGHFESACNLGVDRDFRLQGQGARARLGAT